MKKMLLLVLFSILATPMLVAQNINKGDFYIGARTSGLDFSFSDKTNIGLYANAGYFIVDKLAAGGEFGLRSYDSNTSFRIMGNASYYFLETGSGALYGRFGMGVDKLAGAGTSFAIDITAGYGFFVAANIAIEPAAGFFIPFKEGRDASFNLGLGFSLYF